MKPSQDHDSRIHHPTETTIQAQWLGGLGLQTGCLPRGPLRSLALLFSLVRLWTLTPCSPIVVLVLLASVSLVSPASVSLVFPAQRFQEQRLFATASCSPLLSFLVLYLFAFLPSLLCIFLIRVACKDQTSWNLSARKKRHESCPTLSRKKILWQVELY